MDQTARVQIETRDADVELMLRSRDGDTAAFEVLYLRYYRRVLDFFYAMARDAGLAEDLCHDTFLRIWKLRARYAATGPFPAYLFAFARNIWFEKRRERNRLFRLGLIGLDAATIPFVDRSLGGRPGDAAERSELAGLIGVALNTLPDDQRMAFVLRNVEGLSLDEIATVMMCPVNTVRSRRILAIRKLRESLLRVFASDGV